MPESPFLRHDYSLINATGRGHGGARAREAAGRGGAGRGGAGRGNVQEWHRFGTGIGRRLLGQVRNEEHSHDVPDRP
ncbi:hypothetical protein GCM10009779_19500 [Polymorphospora rubra]